MATEELIIGKRLIDGAQFYSLSDLAQKRSKQKPNEVLRNWINQADTVEFIEEWERSNNPRYKADSFIRFKMNHYNQKRLASLYEFIRRLNTSGIKSLMENPSGIYAHLDIALEFMCWMDPKVRLQLYAIYRSSQNFSKKNPLLDLFDPLQKEN
ncbi:MAG: KilA-N domain-containing protein [Bacteroidota bacterium]